jgi:hypothetical protein
MYSLHGKEDIVEEEKLTDGNRRGMDKRKKKAES